MQSQDPFRQLQKDGLATPEVGPWAEEKYRHLYHYARMFSTSMKGSWDHRVYIDLFAAAGRSRVRDTEKIILSSALLALEIPHQFDRYIFCEEKTEVIDALRKRMSLKYPTVDVRYIEGDVNHHVDSVIDAMPPHGPESKVLSFCFVDPFGLRDIRFTTIRRLASRFVDFLVLIPTGMDALRNIELYMKLSDNTVAQFLGSANWRELWQRAARMNVGFDMFIAEMFSDQMKTLGYPYGGLDKSVLIRSREKNLPLYRLGFYSRNPLGGKFWEEARKSSTDQQSLFGP